MTRSLETRIITWQGRTIEVSYEERWLGTEGPFNTAHLQVRVQQPERAPLPITETGYRSHFTDASVIEAEGGPAAFVLAWLDEAAKAPEWKARELASRQMSLF